MSVNTVKQAALIIAAMAAMTARHFDHGGFGINRREFRNRYKKRKGGGRGVGIINGLPRVGVSQAEVTNFHSNNRAAWRGPRHSKPAERSKHLR